MGVQCIRYQPLVLMNTLYPRHQPLELMDILNPRYQPLVLMTEENEVLQCMPCQIGQVNEEFQILLDTEAEKSLIRKEIVDKYTCLQTALRVLDNPGQ